MIVLLFSLGIVLLTANPSDAEATTPSISQIDCIVQPRLSSFNRWTPEYVDHRAGIISFKIIRTGGNQINPRYRMIGDYNAGSRWIGQRRKLLLKPFSGENVRLRVSTVPNGELIEALSFDLKPSHLHKIQLDIVNSTNSIFKNFKRLIRSNSRPAYVHVRGERLGNFDGDSGNNFICEITWDS